MAKIFIIEDDKGIQQELSRLLASYGHTCIVNDDFEHIVEHVLDTPIDLVLLDINLPFYDGYYVCREIRSRSDVPIIIVTSRNSDMDELMSMNLGADDFITKPYNTQILLAHISAVLKRSMDQQPSMCITHKDVTLNVASGVLQYENEVVELTKNEQRILTLLMRNQGQIISRDDIMNALWQSDEFIDDNTLTVNIGRLRKKLEEIGIEGFLVTKRGQGYMV